MREGARCAGKLSGLLSGGEGGDDLIKLAALLSEVALEALVHLSSEATLRGVPGPSPQEVGREEEGERTPHEAEVKALTLVGDRRDGLFSGSALADLDLLLGDGVTHEVREVVSELIVEVVVGELVFAHLLVEARACLRPVVLRRLGLESGGLDKLR